MKIGSLLMPSHMEMQHAYNEVMENGTVHPPKIVSNEEAPCKENIWTGDEVDLTKLPAPLAQDGLVVVTTRPPACIWP